MNAPSTVAPHLSRSEAEYMALVAPEPCTGAEVLNAYREGYDKVAHELGMPTTHAHSPSDAVCQAGGALAVARLVAGASLAQATRPVDAADGEVAL